MIKKKLFKILAVISAFIFIFCSFCFSASAASSIAEVTDYSVKSVSNYYGEMDYRLKIIGEGFYTSGFVCDFVQYDIFTDYNAYNIFMDFPTTFAVREVITVSGALIVPANTTSVKIAFGGFANYELFDTSICTKMYAEDTFDYYLPFSYSFKVSTASIDKLNRVYFTVSGSSNLWGFGISNIKFETKTDVNDVVSGATNNIVNNQNNNTNSIINNQNNNASQIQANQDKNTDKILNGGKDKPGYSSVDNTTTDEHKALEDDINNKTVEARSSTVSFFNNFGLLLNDTPLSHGLLAVSKIMTEFFGISWLASLINFALGIGAFAFILGSVIMVVGKVSSRSSSERNRRRKGD